MIKRDLRTFRGREVTSAPPWSRRWTQCKKHRETGQQHVSRCARVGSRLEGKCQIKEGRQEEARRDKKRQEETVD
jgi:hypothetical protein